MAKKSHHPSDIYADALSAGELKVLATFNRDSLAFEILSIAESNMRAAAADGVTHLTTASTHKGSTYLMLLCAASPSDADASKPRHATRYNCECRPKFFPDDNVFLRLVQRASLRLLGRDRFCQRFARSMCVEIARKEAEHLHSVHEPLPAGLLARRERDQIAAEAAPSSSATHAIKPRL